MRPHVVHWLEAILPGGLASALAPTWFTCVGLAGIATLFAMLAVARRHRIDPAAAASAVLWCYLAAVAAGIAVPATIDAAEQLLATGRVQIRWAGMTSFWGYLAGGLAVAAVCRAHAVPLARFADLAVAPLGGALVLARLGCFLAGCDYGKVSALPWAVRFPAHSPAWQDHVNAGLVAADRGESLPVHPTQLYEAALGLAIAIVAAAVARRRWARSDDGRMFVLAAAIYAVGRLVVEDLRGDTGRGIYLGLSSGQIFSLLVLAAIAAGAWLRRVRPNGAAAPATAAAAVIALIGALAARDVHAQPPQPQAPQSQPQPQGPQPQPPQPPQPPPLYAPRAPGSMPGQPMPGQPMPGQPMPGQPMPGQPMPGQQISGPGGVDASGAGDGESGRGSSIQIGALAGAAAAFNRRRDQVPALAGASLSFGFELRQLGFWLDLESLGNRDASHGTILLSGSAMFPVARRLSIGARVGLGATLVNFDDPAFRDVVGTTGRFEMMMDLRLGESWSLWIRPLAIDVLTAPDLGGPIATWQTRIGLAYRIAVGRRAGPRAVTAARSVR